MIYKNQAEILQEMVGYTSAVTGSITDFTVGSGVRTMYDSFSIELEEFYMLSIDNIKEGIESGLMSAFDFKPKVAQRAYGQFKLTVLDEFTEAKVLPRGTTISSSKESVGVTFETLTDYTLPIGATEFYVTAYCTEAGVIGNVDKGVMDMIPFGMYSINSVENTEDILTGAEEATYEETKRLFKLFVASRGRATKQALEYGALSVNEVTGAYVDEKVGVAYVYCHDNNGNLDDALKLKVERVLEDYRPAGIETKVLPITKYVFDLYFTVEIADPAQLTTSFKEGLTKYIRQYLNSFSANDDLVLSELVQIVMNYDDEIIYDCYFDDLDSNVILNASEILRAGSINLTYV